MFAQQSQRPVKKRVFLSLLFLVMAGISYIALVGAQFKPFSSPSYQAGQVALQDILAPQNITYESSVLTEQQRESAARAIPPIYTSPDTGVARQQLEQLRSSLAFITSVRSDSHSSQEQMITDLAALQDIRLSQEMAGQILGLNDQRWQTVQQEAIVTLEQVMRNTIREDRLENARESVPALVSLSLPEEQAVIVAELAAAFVAPNSFYNESQTEATRQNARQAVEPVARSYKAGETIIQRGQVISQADLEALQKLGLVQPQDTWKLLASAAALVALEMVFLLFYLRRNTRLLTDLRGLLVSAILFLIFLVAGRFIINQGLVVAFIFPLAAYSLTIAALFGQNRALVTTLLLAILITYNVPDALVLMLYYTLGGFFGVLVLGRAQRVTSFFWAGLVIAGSGALVVIAYFLNSPTRDLLAITSLSGAALINGVASASLALLLQFLLAQLVGMTTALQLMEISRPDHPLLQLMLRAAPGTYQHSLQVANLAEQAADEIGADTLLTRVGAQYHDVGKALTPMLFIENQVPGSPNPHETLTPQESAQIIIRHIPEGVVLARKYRIPSRIQDFIREHHGNMIARYQYFNAVKAAGGDESKVDPEPFRYPGPRPQSRETAILMLADGSEARVRAERPQNENEMREVIKSVIQNRMSSGQLDDTGLTLRDLEAITNSFVTTLRGIYHPRIEYPKLDRVADQNLDPTPTVPTADRHVPDKTASAQPERRSTPRSP
jgi:putative nucleotidyltransferase with HDIG domain